MVAYMDGEKLEPMRQADMASAVNLNLFIWKFILVRNVACSAKGGAKNLMPHCLCGAQFNILRKKILRLSGVASCLCLLNA